MNMVVVAVVVVAAAAAAAAAVVFFFKRICSFYICIPFYFSHLLSCLVFVIFVTLDVDVISLFREYLSHFVWFRRFLPALNAVLPISL
jgi:hypothetical protein